MGSLEKELLVLRLEGVRDVLDEDQAEDDVLAHRRGGHRLPPQAGAKCLMDLVELIGIEPTTS